MRTSNALDPEGTEEAAEDTRGAVWALGDYATVARDVVGGLGPVLVEACGIRAGQKVLDVAAGSGSAAIPAAERGADVTALDLTPKLLEAGHAEAKRRGVAIEWIEGDAETLPFDNDGFDVVMSAIGAIFAPDHDAAARELVRVCRPGGTIGMINWPPEGSVANFFQTLSAYAPPPAAGSRSPLLWGSEEYVRDLFGDAIEALETKPGRLIVDHFRNPQEWCDYYKRNFGPTIATYAGIAHDPDLVARLDADFLADATKSNVSTDPGRVIYELDYLLVMARKPLQ